MIPVAVGLLVLFPSMNVMPGNLGLAITLFAAVSLFMIGWMIGKLLEAVLTSAVDTTRNAVNKLHRRR